MNSVLTSVFSVFEAVANWIITAIQSVIPMFYVAEGSNAGLTFLGVLAVAGLGISVVFLLIGIIQRFLHFGG